MYPLIGVQFFNVNRYRNTQMKIIIEVTKININHEVVHDDVTFDALMTYAMNKNGGAGSVSLIANEETSEVYVPSNGYRYKIITV